MGRDVPGDKAPRRGEPITAEFLNFVADHVLRRVTVAQNGRATVKNGRLTLDLDGPAAPPVIRYMRVQSVEADYITAIAYNPATDTEIGAEISVAKPYGIRQTPFDGQTISYDDGTSLSYSYSTQRKRTATDTSDSSTEEQVVTPDYFVDDEIQAMRMNTGLQDTSGNDIMWVDMNTMTPRYWATEA